MKKKLCIVCLVMLIFWVLLVSVDCVRLRNADVQTKPLLTLKTEETEHRLTYHGLGYHVVYYVNMGEIVVVDGITYKEQLGYGAEFRVLGFLVWAWIE